MRMKIMGFAIAAVAGILLSGCHQIGKRHRRHHHPAPPPAAKIEVKNLAVEVAPEAMGDIDVK